MKALVEKIITIIFKIIGVFHSPKTIYFESFHGSQFSDNPKAIYQWMKQTYPEYKLVWGVNKGQEKPFRDEKVSYVLRFSFKWFLTMPRAGVWVINTRTPLWLVKNKKTIYLQTWHGTPLKTIGQDIETVNIPGYTKESYDLSFSEESKRWDYLISPNSYSTEIFKRAFAYEGTVLETGYPRNDILVEVANHQNVKKALKEKLKLPTNKKIVLYAPTWRETAKRLDGKYTFETDFPFEKVITALGKETILLVRMHYLVAKQINLKEISNQIVDVSVDYDMNELLAISDLLITDYSSCMFDFSITNSPMIFYMPDQVAYEEEMRGFYFQVKENLPGEIIQTEKDLLTLISSWEKGELVNSNENYTAFKERFTSLETGQAAKNVVENILHTKGVKR